MRVIAGVARSLKLRTPEGLEVRPTTDRIKETLFNMIQAELPGSTFLDVFSGSGAIGIEALSRGAKIAYFIENSKAAIQCIEHNLEHTRLMDKAVLVKSDYLSALSKLHEQKLQFDVIFLDPPYNKGYEEKAITCIFQKDLLVSNGLIICESDLKTSFDFVNGSDSYQIWREKLFLTNKFTFIRKVI